MRYLTALSFLLANVSGSLLAQSTQIPIVTNEKPLWAKGKEWRVADRPMLDIGKAEAEPEYELSQVRGMLRLADGTIVVANQHSELRYYDKSGKYIRTAGRRGEGPGEFKSIAGLTVLRDGNVGVHDWPHGIQVYSADGKFVRLQPPPAGTSSPATIVLDNGAVVIGNRQPVPRGGTGIYTDSLALTLHNPQAQTRIGTVPVGRFVSLGNRAGGLLFGPGLENASRGQTWYAGFSDRWQITQYNAGVPQRIIRRAWSPVEITAADRQRFRETPFTMMGEGDVGDPVTPRLLEQRKRLYVDEAFAKTLPAFGELHVDAAGNLWAEVPHKRPSRARMNDTDANPTEWSVFDPAGRWLGQVQTPGNLWIFEIGSDYVLGLSRDEFDVEHVRMYAITKPR